MGRPRAEDPRSNQLILRLTDGQVEILNAIAYLEGTTANQYAFEQIISHLVSLSETSAHVQREIANRRDYQSQNASVSKLPSRRRAPKAQPTRRVGEDAK